MVYLGPDVRLVLGCCHDWSWGHCDVQVISEVMRGVDGCKPALMASYYGFNNLCNQDVSNLVVYFMQRSVVDRVT